jgi:hypothetical protein
MATFPVVTLNSAAYTPEIVALVQASQVTARFRYELLNANGGTKGFLNCVQDGGSIDYNFFSDIKRRCSFGIAEIGNFELIDFLSDRIKVYYEIFSPYRSAWLSFPLGVYVLSSATRTVNNKLTTRNVEGYDQTQILKRKKHLTRFVVPVGSDPIEVVRGLIVDAGLSHDIYDNPDVTNDLVQAERSYDPGSEYIATINNLLGMINYKSLYFDDNGIAVSSPYVAPGDRVVEVGYVTDDSSVIAQGANLTLDISEIPNVVNVVVSQPDRPAIVGIARNDNPESPTSTVSRGEDIVLPVTDNEDVTTLDQANTKAYQVLIDQSQIYEVFEFQTALVPLHGENTMLGITYNDLEVSDIYSETEYRISLSVGDNMTHRARKLVTF